LHERRRGPEVWEPSRRKHRIADPETAEVNNFLDPYVICGWGLAWTVCRDYGRTSREIRPFYRRIPLLAFFSRKATSKAGMYPLLRWMTETTSERCMLAMLMPLTIKLVTL
jgi:hypothetical protein